MATAAGAFTGAGMGEFARSAARPGVAPASNARTEHNFVRTSKLSPQLPWGLDVVELVREGLGLVGANLGLTGARPRDPFGWFRDC